MAINITQLLNLGFLIATLVFMYSDGYIAIEDTYTDFIRIGAIITLCLECIVFCLFLCLIASLSVGSDVCSLLSILLAMYAILFGEAYYVSAAIYFSKSSYFTDEAPDAYRLTLEIVAIVTAVSHLVTWTCAAVSTSTSTSMV